MNHDGKGVVVGEYGGGQDSYSPVGAVVMCCFVVEFPMSFHVRFTIQDLCSTARLFSLVATATKASNLAMSLLGA